MRFFSYIIVVSMFGASLFFFIVPQMTLAQSDYGLGATASDAFKGTTIQAQSEKASVATIVGRVINVVLSFVGVVFLILIIYGGFIWMTAGGSEEKVGQAINIFTAAAYGLMIVIAAFLITRYIGTALINSLQ
ncbi:hypothetical protein A2477_00205 [Candidatus Falkowbacteria bacterium RIFOXYC2_FULL_47_12]|uniref:TrbC/VIRB2 family protein n=2 Tax=Candidatus Falkowiibacteriota TaxID=1752728 RepID=A0A1F5TQB4_9BACT|nr:MAG: hypothetical protein A2242_04080 [Candidatus Falkowbacteria bacterium RIFOXYA2_FULL_47_9]OGF41096.1 MAG: hypothetical protein A2477_00205 [Candidatus Falkowbacteria bacterium RIFOXYC2_FULL_47_12]